MAMAWRASAPPAVPDAVRASVQNRARSHGAPEWPALRRVRAKAVTGPRAIRPARRNLAHGMVPARRERAQQGFIIRWICAIRRAAHVTLMPYFAKREPVIGPAVGGRGERRARRRRGSQYDISDRVRTGS